MRRRKQIPVKKTAIEAGKKDSRLSKHTKCEDIDPVLTCTFVKTLLQNNELEVCFKVQAVVGEYVLRLFSEHGVKLGGVCTAINSSREPRKCGDCGEEGVGQKKVLSFSVSVDEDSFKCNNCQQETQGGVESDGQNQKPLPGLKCQDGPSKHHDKSDVKCKDITTDVAKQLKRKLSGRQRASNEIVPASVEIITENTPASDEQSCKMQPKKQNELPASGIESVDVDEDNDVLLDIKDQTVSGSGDHEQPKRLKKDHQERKKNNADNSRHVCNICGKKLLNLKTLKSHMTTHEAGLTHICKICSRRFSHIRYLKKHEKTHIKEKPYICEICGQRFKLKESLPKHMILHGDKKPFQCDICQKQFHLEEQMKKHASIHTDERKFICELCGKRFRTQGSMKSHKDTHEGPLKHSCEQCGKSYRSAWYLKIHKKTHTGENLIQCKDCDDWFIDPCYFKLHQKKFCKGKPLLCSQCGLELPHNQALQSHMGLHTGERPFGCKTCGKAFAKASLLSEHVKRHSLDKCLRCGFCKKGFINNKELKRHERCHVRKKKKASLPENLKPRRADMEVNSREVVGDGQVELKVVSVTDAQTGETSIGQLLQNTEYVQVVSTADDTSLPGGGETFSVSCIRYVPESIVETSSSTFQQTAAPAHSEVDHTGASTQVLSSRGGHITVHDPISITHVYADSGQVTEPPNIQFAQPSFTIPQPEETPQQTIISTPDGEHLQQLQPITTSTSVSLAYENETSVQHLLQAAAIIKDYTPQY